MIIQCNMSSFLLPSLIQEFQLSQSKSNDNKNNLIIISCQFRTHLMFNNRIQQLFFAHFLKNIILCENQLNSRQFLWLYTICQTNKTMAKYKKNQQQKQNVNRLQQKYSQSSEDDESYVPKSLKIRKKKSQTKQAKQTIEKTLIFNNSLWSLKQNYAYMAFLKENQHYFSGSWHQRKSIKINVMMSKAIGTRSPAQCRSHHQKMMKYHESIPKIIQYIHELQCAAHVAQPEFHKQEPTAQTLNSDVVLQDFSQRWAWTQDYEDLWNRMMDEKWMEGADEYFSFKQA